mgnify:CR=1 FL=1
MPQTSPFVPPSPERLKAHWMPFSSNRDFHADPRFIAGAGGRWLIDAQGRRVFDSLSGLWTCGAGHCRPEIAQAVARQLSTLDYSPAFQFAHPLSFELAERIAAHFPDPLNHVFFTDSGSESADTAVKMARAYWRIRGQAGRPGNDDGPKAINAKMPPWATTYHSPRGPFHQGARRVMAGSRRGAAPRKSDPPVGESRGPCCLSVCLPPRVIPVRRPDAVASRHSRPRGGAVQGWRFSPPRSPARRCARPDGRAPPRRCWRSSAPIRRPGRSAARRRIWPR